MVVKKYNICFIAAFVEIREGTLNPLIKMLNISFSRFPQYNLPTFKIDKSGCLKKVQIGEEISLVR